MIPLLALWWLSRGPESVKGGARDPLLAYRVSNAVKEAFATFHKNLDTLPADSPFRKT